MTEETAARPEPRTLAIAATVCAAVVLASQLAGKAARDAIFLQSFEVTNLPLLIAASSALAIATTFVFAQQLSRGVPARVVRIANLASAAMLVAEWLAIDHLPRPVAVVVYVHQALLGPILVSGFWSVIGECFDPRTARKYVGAIGTGATVGGLVGAVLAERVAALAGTHALLLLIAGLQLAAVWRFGALQRGSSYAQSDEPHPAVIAIAKQIVQVSLLRRLAAITLIVTVAAALLDYVFKSVVAAEVARDDLARLFATFHGVVGLLTAIVQWVFGRRALQSWGLARTLATLPGAVIAFGAMALIAPGVGTYAALRGAEQVLRSSLYRGAYEVFYTPLLPAERRATKTVIDVGVERLGDLLGGLAIMLLLAAAGASPAVLVAGGIALAVAGVVVALQAQASYVEALERSLAAHAIELDKYEPPDRTTRTTIEQVELRASGFQMAATAVGPAGAVAQASASGTIRTSGLAQPGRGRWAKRPRDETAPAPAPAADARAASTPVQRIVDLASDDAARIRGALAGGPLPATAIAHVIPLLGRPDLARPALRALAAAAAANTGQLVDALRDTGLPIGVRAQLPRLIARAGGDLARAGLTACLGDAERELRFHAAEALAELRDRDPELVLDPAVVFDGVRRELAGEGVSERARQHLATLLALALPSEPVRTAFHGLRSEDRALRGVALEYLDNVLPGDIRERMWRVLALEAPVPSVEKRAVEDVLAELLRTRRGRDANELEMTKLDLPGSIAVK